MKQSLDIEITTIPQLLHYLRWYRDAFKDQALTSEYMRGRYNQNETIIALIQNTDPELIEDISLHKGFP